MLYWITFVVHSIDKHHDKVRRDTGQEVCDMTICGFLDPLIDLLQISQGCRHWIVYFKRLLCKLLVWLESFRKKIFIDIMFSSVIRCNVRIKSCRPLLHQRHNNGIKTMAENIIRAFCPVTYHQQGRFGLQFAGSFCERGEGGFLLLCGSMALYQHVGVERGAFLFHFSLLLTIHTLYYYYSLKDCFIFMACSQI